MTWNDQSVQGLSPRSNQYRPLKKPRENGAFCVRGEVAAGRRARFSHIFPTRVWGGRTGAQAQGRWRGCPAGVLVGVLDGTSRPAGLKRGWLGLLVRGDLRQCVE